MLLKKIIPPLLFTLLSTCCLSQKVKVTGISDGDTFTALFADNHTERIRLYGIDCPENGQAFSKLAKKFLSDGIMGKSVELRPKGRDRYKRTIAIVYSTDTISINEQLLIAGLAWHYKQYDKNEKWDALEQQARKNKAGLWNGTEQAIAPWLWRKKPRKKIVL